MNKRILLTTSQTEKPTYLAKLNVQNCYQENLFMVPIHAYLSKVNKHGSAC